MEQDNKYIDDVERLVEFYQFPSDAPSKIFAEGYSLAFFVAKYLAELTTGEDVTSISNNITTSLKELEELEMFVALCKGGEITMTGKAQQDAFGYTQRTKVKVTFKDNGLIDSLGMAAYMKAQQIERFINKTGIEHEGKLDKNKLLGKYADELLFYIEGFDFGKISDTKKYSFIYDALLMAGALAGNTNAEIINNEGFDSDVGHEKSKQVDRWLDAYKKHKNKQKD